MNLANHYYLVNILGFARILCYHFSMLLSFHGAAREVTGSCYLLETAQTRVLIDCGMFQGSTFSEARNYDAFKFDPSTIDAVIITHAHLDHTGRLPKLVNDGYKGKIYLTPPTRDLTRLVLEDAYHIMKEDFKREYRPLLYELEDVNTVERNMVTVEYEKTWTVGDLSFRFRDAGHIFGSAFVEVEEKGGARVTFSGDIGNDHVPILRETAELASTDVLLTESTYGNRIHEDESTRVAKLREVVTRTVQQGGVLMIPAFAIERTQQLLYELHDLSEQGLLPRVDIYLDSPMAIDTTNIIRSYPQYYDAEALKVVSMGDDLFQVPGLHFTRSRDESKAINDAPKPKIIIAGAGMMNGGRIRHHLIRYLGDPRSSVLIIGYQAEGTLGRHLYRGDKTVTVLGERVEVRASVIGIGAYSAHGDQNKLVRWIGGAAHRPSQVLCTHGDEGACMALATRLEQEGKLVAHVPRLFDSIKL
ncbi:MAG: MBL fold metallo-hydrolase [bacterium]|nr:MBL fold metallo-hydrolase [bacterium]